MGASGVSRNPRPPARGRLLPDKKPRPIVTAKNEACVTCHGEKAPGIVAQWEGSTHATLGVGCADYHAANKGSPDAWEREGSLVATIVSPRDCAKCHMGPDHPQIEIYN